MNATIVLSRDALTIADLAAAARHDRSIAIDPETLKDMHKSRLLVEKWVREKKTVYGVTTGFGLLSDVIIDPEDTRTLQRNLLISHACGVGQPFSKEVARAMMVLRIKDLLRANSSARPDLANRLAAIFNNGIVPVIPQKGSVGASGDLCPLAHLSLVLIGLGEAWVDGVRLPGREALSKRGLEPMELASGEGLALVNGTQAMTAVGALALYDAANLCKSIDIAAAMSLEVLMGSRTEFDPRIQQNRPHPGQAAAADNMLRMIRNSEIITSHKDCSRVQDAYTLRCSPQVHGASYDAIQLRPGNRYPHRDQCIYGQPADFQRYGAVSHRRQLSRPAHCPGPGFCRHGYCRACQYLRAAHRAPGQSEVERHAGFPGQGQRPEFRFHDRPVHCRGAGIGKQGAGPSRLRGLHSHFGQQGRSCLHGNHCCTKVQRDRRQRRRCQRH
jgi:hypothetical protein